MTTSRSFITSQQEHLLTALPSIAYSLPAFQVAQCESRRSELRYGGDPVDELTGKTVKLPKSIANMRRQVTAHTHAVTALFNANYICMVLNVL